MSKELSVSQLLQQEHSYRDDLGAKGIALINARNQVECRLFIVHDIVREQLLQNTRWKGTCIDQVLLRLPGADRSQQRCAGQRPWGVSLPWPGCLDDLSPQDNQEDTPGSVE